MNDSDFQQLLASVKEAGRIKRSEQEPVRKFKVRDVQAVRVKLRGDSEKQD